MLEISISLEVHYMAKNAVCGHQTITSLCGSFTNCYHKAGSKQFYRMAVTLQIPVTGTKKLNPVPV